LHLLSESAGHRREGRDRGDGRRRSRGRGGQSLSPGSGETTVAVARRRRGGEEAEDGSAEWHVAERRSERVEGLEAEGVE
jgi:hypothetical protein